MNKGFSLIEVVLAIMVVAIGVVSVVGLFSEGLKTNKKTLDDTVVSTFASGVLGGFKSAGWNKINNGESLPQFNDSFWDVANVITINSSAVLTNILVAPNDVYYPLRYQIDIQTIGMVKTMTLYVWPGQYGDNPNKDDAKVYYTELYKYEIPTS